MSKKILIVEDEAITALDMRFELEDLNYKVYTADNAEASFKICEKYHPDLILVDINIKGDMNGLEMAEILADKGYKIIFLSAYEANKENFKNTKDSLYLNKPIDIHELAEIIENDD